MTVMELIMNLLDYDLFEKVKVDGYNVESVDNEDSCVSLGMEDRYYEEDNYD